MLCPLCREGPGINYMFLIVNGALLLAVVSGSPCSAAQHSTANWQGVTLLLLVLHQLGLHAAFEVSAGCLWGICRLPGLVNPIHMASIGACCA